MQGEREGERVGKGRVGGTTEYKMWTTNSEVSPILRVLYSGPSVEHHD